MQKSNLGCHECKATAILNILRSKAWVMRCQIRKFVCFFGLAPPKIQSGFAQPILNQSSWIFLSGVFHEFKQFSWFWNKIVLLNHPSEHETTWLYHFQVVSSSFCNLKCTNSTKANGFFLLINFVCANGLFFLWKKNLYSFFCLSPKLLLVLCLPIWAAPPIYLWNQIYTVIAAEGLHHPHRYSL